MCMGTILYYVIMMVVAAAGKLSWPNEITRCALSWSVPVTSIVTRLFNMFGLR